MNHAPAFRDRHHAGQALAAVLGERSWQHPVVLALPRGGVPIDHEIARALSAPLDILLVRKIGAPGHEEYALGAVVDGDEPQCVVDEDMLRLFNPSPDWFAGQMAKQLREIERRRALYRGSRPTVPLERRDLIVVDDGLATGSSARVALKALRHRKPRGIVLAVPVGPLETIEKLRPEVDELFCLEMPEPFRAVGLHYEDFPQVTDLEVMELLAAGAAP